MPQPGIPWARSPRAGSHQLLEPGFTMQNPHPCPFRPPSVGKTSLLHQYVHKTFYEDYRTTLGASILTKVIAVDNTPLKMQVRCPDSPVCQHLPVSPDACWCTHALLCPRSGTRGDRSDSGPWCRPSTKALMAASWPLT